MTLLDPTPPRFRSTWYSKKLSPLVTLPPIMASWIAWIHACRSSRVLHIHSLRGPPSTVSSNAAPLGESGVWDNALFWTLTARQVHVAARSGMDLRRRFAVSSFAPAAASLPSSPPNVHADIAPSTSSS
eukprot:CAMPEP_0185824316 /NCGR_PEP_ID=MMETSP1322-20130828/29483_1 /TAXON_ID=265543 /ORGANISM="Minutocellus polymorphus, Strain RCC2270" /LENGTH=128 /DNA_ID=CAMNT_0028521937 /DNA_START=31 /DNA_END=414 /DNA_ORIENTATION=+